MSGCNNFIERQLEIWYPWLTFVDEKGYDHVDQDGGRYDQKCFTKGGCFFAPSNMIGKGRSLDEEVAHIGIHRTSCERDKIYHH